MRTSVCGRMGRANHDSKQDLARGFVAQLAISRSRVGRTRLGGIGSP